ncbi:MAG: diaminobutyrate acetyltransferase [Planctomycetota bacterium]
MTTKQSLHTQPDSTVNVELRPPSRADGADLWRLARDSGGLDLNAPYAYLLWCDQFSKTSVVAAIDGRPAGFVTGFMRQERPDVLFVWQVTVARGHRGLGLAGRMLDALVERLGPAAVEATVTPSNAASSRLFHGLAKRHGCACSEAPHFATNHFPDQGHEPEVLFHIGPFTSVS